MIGVVWLICGLACSVAFNCLISMPKPNDSVEYTLWAVGIGTAAVAMWKCTHAAIDHLLRAISKKEPA